MDAACRLIGSGGANQSAAACDSGRSDESQANKTRDSLAVYSEVYVDFAMGRSSFANKKAGSKDPAVIKSFASITQKSLFDF